MLATLHLTVRDRFRLIVQRVDAERESAGPRSDYTREVGSLLLHSRALADPALRRWRLLHKCRRPRILTDIEGAEVFVKFQWGMSSTGGFHW